MRRKIVIDVALWVDDSAKDLKLVRCSSSAGVDLLTKGSSTLHWLVRILGLEASGNLWSLSKETRSLIQHPDTVSLMAARALGRGVEGSDGLMHYSLLSWENLEYDLIEVGLDENLPEREAIIKMGSRLHGLTADIPAWSTGYFELKDGSSFVVYSRDHVVYVDAIVVDKLGNTGHFCQTSVRMGSDLPKLIARALAGATVNRKSNACVRVLKAKSKRDGVVLHFVEDRRKWSSGEVGLPVGWSDRLGRPIAPPRAAENIVMLLSEGFFKFEVDGWVCAVQ